VPSFCKQCVNWLGRKTREWDAQIVSLELGEAGVGGVNTCWSWASSLHVLVLLVLLVLRTTSTSITVYPPIDLVYLAYRPLHKSE
jgi:hypothetical protein